MAELVANESVVKSYTDFPKTRETNTAYEGDATFVHHGVANISRISDCRSVKAYETTNRDEKHFCCDTGSGKTCVAGTGTVT